jgi:hypothetical protein
MSGFSAEWLALREPVDAASRNPELIAADRLATARARFLSVLDLGSGTGANFRFLAPLLGDRAVLAAGGRRGEPLTSGMANY